MPVKEERSLIKLDKNLVVALPKGWTDYWDMKKGEKVPIFYNNILIVIPKNYSRKEEIENRLREILEWKRLLYVSVCAFEKMKGGVSQTGRNNKCMKR